MSMHPELPERDRRILGVLVQGYIDDGEPISSLWLAAAASVSRPQRFGTSWPGSKNRGTCGNRTPQQAECRPISATGVTSISSWLSGARRAPRPRSKRGSAALGPSTICSRTHHRKSRGPLNS